MNIFAYIETLRDLSENLDQSTFLNQHLRGRFRQFPSVPGRSEIVFALSYIAYQQAVMKRVGPTSQMSLALSGGHLLDQAAAGCDSEASTLRVVHTDFADPTELSYAQQAVSLRDGGNHSIITSSLDGYFLSNHSKIDDYRKYAGALTICGYGSAASMQRGIDLAWPYIADEAIVLLVGKEGLAAPVENELSSRSALKNRTIKRVMIDGEPHIVAAYMKAA